MNWRDLLEGKAAPRPPEPPPPAEETPADRRRADGFRLRWEILVAITKHGSPQPFVSADAERACPGVSKRAVTKALGELANGGWLTRERSGKAWHYRPGARLLEIGTKVPY